MSKHIHIHLQRGSAFDTLVSGASPAAFSRNVKTEIEAGKPQKQAVAIAYAKKREAGGTDDEPESTASRNELPKSKFGLPGSRRYPMRNARQAGNAKARAAQEVAKGKLSPSSEAKINAKAAKF